MHKFLLVCALASATLVTPLAAFAQTQQVAIPSVGVTAVHLDATTYAEGEVVRGTFAFVNSGSTVSTNVKYVVRLVGGFDANGIWQTEYGSQESEVITLGASEARTMHFAFELPAGVAGTDLAIEVQALLASGFPLGWDDQRITITGTHTFADVTQGYVEIAGTKFATNDGPTIHEGQEAAVVAVVTNPADTELTLHPTLVHRTSTGDTLRTESGTAFTLPSKGTQEVRFVVPFASTNAGVYTATLELADDKGKLHAESVVYRYIIDGASAVIQSLTADKLTAVRHDTVTVTALMTGTPLDINPVDTMAPPVENATLSITLVNERGMQIGEASKEVNLLSERQAALPIVTTGQAHAMRAHATLTRDGVVLASLEVPLSPAYESYAQFVRGVLIVLGILALILLAVGVYLLRRVAQNPMPAPHARRPAFSFLILGVVTILLALFVYFVGVLPVRSSAPVSLIPAAHAEGNQKDYYYGGATEGGGGDVNVIVDPDVCPFDPGEQLEGPCVHTTYMNFPFVVQAGHWESFIRTHLPLWRKTTTAPYRYWQYAYETNSAYGIQKSTDRVVMYGQTRLTNPFTHEFDLDGGTTSLLYTASDAGAPEYSYFYSVTGTGYDEPYIRVNPIPGPVRPGEEFEVGGSITYFECSNSPASFTVNGTFQGEEFTQEFPVAEYATYVHLTAQKRFAHTFTAPTTPGTYRVYFNIGWEIPNHWLGSSMRGYIDISVEGLTDMEAGAITPTVASQNVVTTVSAPVTNSGVDASNVSDTRFEIKGPDFETVTITSEQCEFTKDGEVCYPVSTETEEGLHEFEYIDQPIIAGDTTETISFPYTFTQLGTYLVQACADTQTTYSLQTYNGQQVYITGTTIETSEENNCGPWTEIVVSEAAPTLTCEVDDTSVSVGQSVTYTVTPANGASGPYSWDASDGAGGLGSGSTATRSFSTGGTYGMEVTGASSISDFCPNVAVGGADCGDPEGELSAVPNRVRQNVSTGIAFTYEATGVDESCTVAGPGVSIPVSANSCTVAEATTNASISIATQSTYTLTCDGEVVDTAIINVIPEFEEF